MSKHGSKGKVDRRVFLGSAAAVGSGLVLAPRTAARAAEAPADALNVAIIGTGSQGQHLLSTCVKFPGVRFTAVCDIWSTYNLKRGSRILANEFQDHTKYVDYREMLEKHRGLDAVIIATPDCCHAEQAIACLRAGLHVYCEAPMSNTLDGARQMVLSARQAKKHLQIGQQRRSNPRYIHCVEKLLGELKLLGTIAALNGQWNRPVQPSRGYPRRFPVPEEVLTKYGYDSMRQFRNWQWYRNLGAGPLAALGSHQIDVFNWFLGTHPTAVMASGGTNYYDRKTHQWHETVMAILEYPYRDGTARAFYQVVNTNSNLTSYEKLLGDQGALLLSEPRGLAVVYREEAAHDWDRWVNLEYLAKTEDEAAAEDSEEDEGLSVTRSIEPTQYDVPVAFDEPVHKPHLENFFNAVRGTAALTCPADVAYATAVTVFKINEAIESGRTITLKPADYSI